MQLNSDVLNKVNYLIGSSDVTFQLSNVVARAPFEDIVIEFLNDVSKNILGDSRARKYSDVVTFGFWIRRSSVMKLKKRFDAQNAAMRLGRGVAFHISPSNVPVNFAYSLVSGLLTGNANVVRVPSKDFPQVTILTDAFEQVLKKYSDMKPYVLLVRYDRDKEINDFFSSIADVRIVWGGNATIEELRKSPLPPRSSEVTFADRYSLAVIDSDSYMRVENKTKVANDFYNDTFLTDQNACTSPRVVIWTGSKIDEAKKIFWKEEHDLVKRKYTFQPIQGVNKLTSSYMIAAAEPGVHIQKSSDNLIVRVSIPRITDRLMDYKDNSGYFFEYDCKDILSVRELCNDKRCQTIAYLGENSVMQALIRTGIKGVDRVVPLGKTMDFDLIWDGYELPALLTRTIVFA